MSIVDEKRLLTDDECEIYQQLLKLHDYKPYHFLLEVIEDQCFIDMNDINYVIMLKIKITAIHDDIEKIYYSESNSQTWLSEFENDLRNNYYIK